MMRLCQEFKNDAGNFNSGLKIRRPPADQHPTTIQIPTSVTAASFLKHAALTPAQREYLHTIASSYSTEHARSLITQHYLNVLYRCIQTDYSPEGDTLPPAPVASPENDGAGRQSKAQSERPSRLFDASAPERRKVKKWTRSSQTQGRKNPRRARIKLLDEEEEEEGPYDPLSDCLSSLSVEEWNSDSLSDL